MPPLALRIRSLTQAGSSATMARSQRALKQAGGLNGAQDLDRADEGLALGYDAVGEFGVAYSL